MQQYLKAIYGAVAAGLAAAYPYTQNGQHFDLQAGLTVAIAVVGSFGVIWGVPNLKKQSAPASSAPPAPPAE